ncbi:MAG TPA: ABC transporter permease, partial [Kofleriaceae bacterium]|nr:ABC transporter permease [Kofleriaceae bacterium]
MKSGASASPPWLRLTHPAAGALLLELGGTWRVGEATPPATAVEREIDAGRPEHVRFDTRELLAWNSALVSFAARVSTVARAAGASVERGGLPAGVQRLLVLIEATAARSPSAARRPPSALARIGLGALARRDAANSVLTATGELTVALGKLVLGRAKFRRSDLWLQIQSAGPRALGIVGLVNGLVGLIIAFIGAVQLQSFGATLYVANLTGVAMVRELGAVMTALIVAGRTGAAFAAELGTMRVTQEIDAVTTLGLSPVEFLVLPRVLAVTLMMPLLCVYADLLGVLGGAVVGVGVLHIPVGLFFDQLAHAVALKDLVGGIVKATTYGFLVGAAGCFMGLHAGRSAAAVGKAATSAVVAGIVLTIMA